jgi:hypothetical protein
MLTAQPLLELERRWQAAQAPLLGRWAEGLSPDEMEELTAPLRLRLPTEARVPSE